MNRKYFKGKEEFTASPSVWFIGLSLCHPAKKFNSSVALLWLLWSWHCRLKNIHWILLCTSIGPPTGFVSMAGPPSIKFLQLRWNRVCFNGWASYQQISSIQVNYEICMSMKNWLKIEWEKDRSQANNQLKSRRAPTFLDDTLRWECCVVWNFLPVNEADWEVQRIITS